ncbi:MAG TPA: MarR family winged helix-turn-helix transcriptional regulator [Actinopolymorphaceae bacterium]|nr:MarR family winged helix-turn-helix transcriptional regulator [Actinopolymorphaceae bacterium]
MSNRAADQGGGGPQLPDRRDTLEVLEREVTVLVRRALRGLWDHGYGPNRVVDRHTYPLLVLLAEEGPLRVGEVARWFRLDKSTVSRHLARLAAAHLIESVADPSDARSALLRVTDAGTAQLADIRRARRERMRAAVADWPEDDIEGLARLLARLNGDLRALRREQH